MEQIEFNLLFRWFVGLGMDDPVWDASTFYHNRDRLLEADISALVLNGVIEHRKVRESRLCFMGHALMENRNGLVVGGNVTIASGTAEREAALELIDRHCPGKRRRTLGADKAYDVTAFVDDLRRRKVTPHVAVRDHLSKTGKRRRPGSTAAPRVIRATPSASVSASGSRRSSVGSKSQAARPRPSSGDGGGSMHHSP